MSIFERVNEGQRVEIEMKSKFRVIEIGMKKSIKETERKKTHR